MVFKTIRGLSCQKSIVPFSFIRRAGLGSRTAAADVDGVFVVVGAGAASHAAARITHINT